MTTRDVRTISCYEEITNLDVIIIIAIITPFGRNNERFETIMTSGVLKQIRTHKRLKRTRFITRSKQQKGSDERLFILTRTHSMQIFGEFPFIKPQNDT